MVVSPDILRPAEPVTPIDVEETVPLLFDFSLMAPGDSISGTPVLTCQAIAGEDAGAAGRLTGAPQVTGLMVTQFAAGCQAGVTYLVRCKAQMGSGLVLVQALTMVCLRVGGG